MGTIKERAYEYGKDFIGYRDGYEAFAEQEDVTRAYITGATEQKQIDTENACETMESLMSFYGIDRDIMMRISKDVRKAMGD